MTDVTISNYIQQHNQILEVPQDILTAFEEAKQVCGFTNVLAQLVYPPKGEITVPGNPEGDNFKRSVEERQASDSTDPCDINPTTAAMVNSSIYGACYEGCATWSTAADYLTVKQPW